MIELGYDQYPEFYNSNKIVFQKDGKNYIHTFNYLNQQYLTESYLELNELCNEFNETFKSENQPFLSEEQKKWLVENDFWEIIDHDVNNEQLEINFYPHLQWYFVKDKSNNHYLLVSLQTYDSQDFAWFKLLKYVQPSFSFPLQDYYINKWL